MKIVNMLQRFSCTPSYLNLLGTADTLSIRYKALQCRKCNKIWKTLTVPNRDKIIIILLLF